MQKHKDELLVEVNQIKEIMTLLSNLFSIRASFLYATDDEEYTNEIAGNNGDYQSFCKLVQLELKHKCIACDRDKFKESTIHRKPILYQCYNGLYEMFLPLFIQGTLVGYLHFGQIRSEKDFKQISEECSLSEHSQIKELERIYNTMNIINTEKLELISQLFQRFADFILKDKLIELRKAKPEFYLKRYIEDNFHKAINVKTAAEFIGYSPSFVIHSFKKKYQIPFHQYLTQFRINHAKTLLKTHTINETFCLCGFKNRYHFSKLFKSIVGMAPHEYKSSQFCPK